MTEIRCVKCGRLLAKVFGEKTNTMTLEVKCPKCSYMNNIAFSERYIHGAFAMNGGNVAVLHN